jgi:hypothetical protein
MNITRLVLISVVLITVSLASASDWSSCQDDLDRLRRGAEHAAYTADRVRSKEDDLEKAQQNLRSCRTRSTDCWSEQSRYRSVLSDFESAKIALESDLDIVSSRIRSVESSCGYDLGQGGFTTSGSRPGDRMCLLMRQLKDSLSNDALLDMCKKSKSEEECKKCLE